MAVDEGAVSKIEAGPVLPAVGYETYRPPRDLRPEAVSRDSMERQVVVVGGEAVSFTTVKEDSAVLPPGVDVGFVEVGQDSEELVVRKGPRIDMWEGKGKGEGICYMGDGQRRMVDSESDLVRYFMSGGVIGGVHQETFEETA